MSRLRSLIAVAYCLLVLQEKPVIAQSETSPPKPTLTNSVGMIMIEITPGTYQRGFDTSGGRSNTFTQKHPYSTAQIFKNESPAHQVAITKRFAISTTEVTVGQFRAFVTATGYKTDAENEGGALGCFPDEKNYVDRFHKSREITWTTPGFPQTDQHPVVAVSWRDATAFCEWLSKKEHQLYRLPTEAQWEYACRAGTSTWYSWGDDPDEAYSHANVADGALEAAHPRTTQFQRAVRLGADQGDGHAMTAPVATRKPNAWGLYDMHGNTWEWCQDRWQADLYDRYFDNVRRQERSQVVVRDPLQLDATDQHEYGDWRVIRGGAWTCAPAAVRSSIRTYAESHDATVYTSFRVIRQLDD
ncbi:MAG: formylglycine-generating enzyme family protein [Aureliella sp.]